MRSAPIETVSAMPSGVPPPSARSFFVRSETIRKISRLAVNNVAMFDPFLEIADTLRWVTMTRSVVNDQPQMQCRP